MNVSESQATRLHDPLDDPHHRSWQIANRIQHVGVFIMVPDGTATRAATLSSPSGWFDALAAA